MSPLFHIFLCHPCFFSSPSLTSPIFFHRSYFLSQPLTSLVIPFVPSQPPTSPIEPCYPHMSHPLSSLSLSSPSSSITNITIPFILQHYPCCSIVVHQCPHCHITNLIIFILLFSSFIVLTTITMFSWHKLNQTKMFHNHK